MTAVLAYERYPLQTTQQLLDLIGPLLSKRGRRLVRRACRWAERAHTDQLRKDDCTPVLQHPLAVAAIVVDLGLGSLWRVVSAAVLHDVVEDRPECFGPNRLWRWLRLHWLFGPPVARAILVLTKKPGQKHPEYVKNFDRWNRMRFLLCAFWWTGGWAVPLLKLADRLHCLRTLDTFGRSAQLRKVEETERLYVPLVDVLRRRLPRNRADIADFLGDQIVGMCELIKGSEEWPAATR